MFASGKFRRVDVLLVLKLESFDASVNCPTFIFTICVTILHRAFRRFVRFGFGPQNGSTGSVALATSRTAHAWGWLGLCALAWALCISVTLTPWHLHVGYFCLNMIKSYYGRCSWQYGSDDAFMQPLGLKSTWLKCVTLIRLCLLTAKGFAKAGRFCSSTCPSWPFVRNMCARFAWCFSPRLCMTRQVLTFLVSQHVAPILGGLAEAGTASCPWRILGSAWSWLVSSNMVAEVTALSIASFMLVWAACLLIFEWDAIRSAKGSLLTK